VSKCRGGMAPRCKVPKCKSAKVRRCQIAKVARRRGAGVVRCRDARCRDARCRDAEMLERWGAGVPRVFRRGIEVVNRQVCSKNADISENPSVDERLPITGSGKARKSAPFGRELRPEEAPPDPVLGCSPSWVAHRLGLLTVLGCSHAVPLGQLRQLGEEFGFFGGQFHAAAGHDAGRDLAQLLRVGGRHPVGGHPGIRRNMRT
jgi:hypothetical protein